MKMLKAFSTSLLLLALILLTISEDIYNLSNNSPKKFSVDNPTEKQEENNFIYQDALISAELSQKQLLNKIRKALIENQDPQTIIAELSSPSEEIIAIHRVPINTAIRNQFGKNRSFFIPSDKEPPGGQGAYLKLFLPVKKNNQQTNYQVTLKSKTFSDIEEKQQLRMYTVTHLQNNRWKTIPTKYQPKKKLSRDLDSSLPDLKPRAEDKGISHYIKNELVIKFQKDTPEKEIQELLAKYNMKLEKRLDHTIVISCKDKQTKELIKVLEEQEMNSKDSHIEYIEPHFIYLSNDIKYSLPTPFTPNDSLYLDYQWNLPIISAEQGWERTQGKESMIIAIVDTGLDLEHPEFIGKLVDGINILEPDSPPLDDDGHGTHVAGIIAANTNNFEGIAGITWHNKIMPIKVLDQSGAGTLFDVAQGVFWATDHGAKVINLSLGNYAESKFLHDAIKYAFSKDVVLVAASGNDGTDQLGYPASYPEVIAVSAIDYDQTIVEFSNYGKYVDVVAPGVNIASTYPSNQYASLSGTSMASPHVAGLAGLIRSIDPTLSNQQINQIIKNTATDLGNPGKDPYYGYGEINIEKALAKAQNPSATLNILTLNWLKTLLERK